MVLGGLRFRLGGFGLKSDGPLGMCSKGSCRSTGRV